MIVCVLYLFSWFMCCRERKHDEVDSHRSKHKKSKRSKRDRDDESGDDDTPKSEEAAP